MRNLILFLILILPFRVLDAQDISITSPDHQTVVQVSIDGGGQLFYAVFMNDKVILEDSPLGLISNVADFSKGLRLLDQKANLIQSSYSLRTIKKREINYVANELVLQLANTKSQRINLVIRVSNNNIALKYTLPRTGETARCIIEKELTGFKFPSFTTTFLTPQASPMIGWMKTKPSYEEEYVPDQAIGTASKYGVGFTFPALFHVGENGWALISETGVSSLYCASKLDEGTEDGLYSISFPEPGENNGIGLVNPSISLPGETPWRTITVGENLKPIVETTISYDVVEPLYQASKTFDYGRSSWSWLEWQDHSMNFDDQITFINLSETMGWEYILIDALWDNQVGYDKVEELIAYAKSKNVSPFLWYNSNGYWNDAPQGPKQRMNTSVARKQEMAWMQKMGVKGIKVDFFGGDKQETMKLYEDILSDANEYGLMVIFHGCTLPRGWEKMYPNFVASEAVLASENLIFTQHSNDYEAYNATLHPFIRNAVGAMDFGPVLLNKRHNRTNDGGTFRRTTETFQLATSILFQSSIQNFGITPNNLNEYPSFVIDFMKNVPTTWDETMYIDGYPGKYVVLARRSGQKWFLAAINAEKNSKKIQLSLPMFAGKEVEMYFDKTDRLPAYELVKVKKTGEVSVVIPSDGAVILVK